ncbi:MAG: CbtB-domain containing protein [Rubrivivax sp.]|nr:CbtB-domain containing protein [Rubrivivax sp.]
MNTSTASLIAPPGTRSYSVLSSLIGAMLLGLVIVFATGFSDVSAAHNAAHDMRHASAFPCH